MAVIFGVRVSIRRYIFDARSPAMAHQRRPRLTCPGLGNDINPAAALLLGALTQEQRVGVHSGRFDPREGGNLLRAERRLVKTVNRAPQTAGRFSFFPFFFLLSRLLSRNMNNVRTVWFKGCSGFG